ncbi:MAG: type II secretion system F family protein [Proteobacteria bacterium]|nr:type II secretion system F family protein [Pseudomonadota bacterium]
MPRFTYKAVDATGEVVEGEMEAVDRSAVIERLRSGGNVPIRADETRGAGALKIKGLRGGPSQKEIALLTRELATLLHAGLPLERALSTLADISDNGAVRILMGRIRDSVRGGSTLADALETYDQIFPTFYSGMVRAGEAGGNLEAVLTRLADTLQKSRAIRENVKSALQYPILVLLLAGVTVVVLMTAVIPEFRPLFDDTGTPLPMATRVVVGISDFFRAYWWALAGGLAFFTYALHRHNRTVSGRLRRDRLVLKLPLFGSLVTQINVARFCRTLGTLMSNGVTILGALSMATETLENRALAESVAEVRGRLQKGEGLTRPLRETGRFPGLALQLIEVGEESGQLETMLLRVADIYEEETERTIGRLLGLLVPVITIGLGVVVAFIIGSLLSAMLSVYDLPF